MKSRRKMSPCCSRIFCRRIVCDLDLCRRPLLPLLLLFPWRHAIVSKQIPLSFLVREACKLFHGFNWRTWRRGDGPLLPTAKKMSIRIRQTACNADFSAMRNPTTMNHACLPFVDHLIMISAQLSLLDEAAGFRRLVCLFGAQCSWTTLGGIPRSNRRRKERWTWQMDIGYHDHAQEEEREQ